MVRTRLEMQILDHLLVKDRLDIELHGKETNGPHLMMSAVWRIAPLDYELLHKIRPRPAILLEDREVSGKPIFINIFSPFPFYEI